MIQMLRFTSVSAPRRTVTPDGTVGSFTTVYANPAEAPAWDILTIQARIVD